MWTAPRGCRASPLRAIRGYTACWMPLRRGRVRACSATPHSTCVAAASSTACPTSSATAKTAASTTWSSATSGTPQITRHEVTMPMSDSEHTPAGRSQPLVSVITPTVNRPSRLHEAIGSAAKAAEKLHGDVEVVVVNDGGPSVSPIVARWSEKLRVRLIEPAEHAGAAAARNIGIEVADGKYIAFLDDDDLFLPDHLVRGCNPLEHDQADFVYLGALVSDRRVDTLPADLERIPAQGVPIRPSFPAGGELPAHWLGHRAKLPRYSGAVRSIADRLRGLGSVARIDHDPGLPRRLRRQGDLHLPSGVRGDRAGVRGTVGVAFEVRACPHVHQCQVAVGRSGGRRLSGVDGSTRTAPRRSHRAAAAHAQPTVRRHLGLSAWPNQPS